MTRQSLALIDVFSSIPDFRQPKGKRHPLKAILALLLQPCCAATALIPPSLNGAATTVRICSRSRLHSLKDSLCLDTSYHISPPR